MAEQTITPELKAWLEKLDVVRFKELVKFGGHLAMGRPKDYEKFKAMMPTAPELKTYDSMAETTCAGCGMEILIGPSVQKALKVSGAAPVCPLCACILYRATGMHEVKVADEWLEEEGGAGGAAGV